VEEQQYVLGDPFAALTFRLARRGVLVGLPAAVILAGPLMRRFAWAQAELASDKLIVHRAAPLMAEAPLASLTGAITPNELFHIVTIIADPLPDIAPADWRLAVEGQVESPFSLNYDQLKALPARTITAVVECAGNSRNSVSPPLPKSFLNNGYVGNARWRGAPLRLVLERAGVKPEARDVVLEGADRGHPPFAPHEVAFAKGIPIEKALHPETLIVYEMNGAPLPREHGGPVRALVPGWYGTYHVKWLTRIEVLDRPFDGVFMTELWRVRHRDNGHIRLGMADQVAVKSLIFTPAPEETLPTGAHTIRGAAWSGGKDITSVHVSTDGGATWRFARLLDAGEDGSPYAWRQWELPWEVREPGTYTLMARATDTSGAAQPFAYDLDKNGFVVNHVQPVTVKVG
jgi:DMSO/TMAO reductase YedYZ molybdopterin-dependent catalytic subunit